MCVITKLYLDIFRRKLEFRNEIGFPGGGEKIMIIIGVSLH